MEWKHLSPNTLSYTLQIKCIYHMTWPQKTTCILNMIFIISSSSFWCVHASQSLQLCLTLCDPVDCNPQDSSVRGISQARILERVATSFSRGFPDPGIEPASLKSPALQAGSLPLVLPGKPLGSPWVPNSEDAQRWLNSRMWNLQVQRPSVCRTRRGQVQEPENETLRAGRNAWGP